MKRSALERSDHAWNDPEGNGHPFDGYFAVFEYLLQFRAPSLCL